MTDTPKYISLYELQSLIKKQIGVSFPLPYWVVAEISELKVNYSGHCYMELVEKSGGGNQAPRAKVSAVIWRNHYAMISSYFRTATGNDLSAGIKVLFKVVVNYHELYGLSLQVTDIEPSFTLGDIEAQKRETIEKLKAEGIYDMNKGYDLPAVIQRIAIVSSANAAGYQDFMNELSANGWDYYFRTELFDAFMQGAESEGSIIASLDEIAERYEDFDVVVLIRGGGSQSDLGTFNGYRISSHLAQFPLPVVTGIGHDKDQSVADLVANVSVKTPTAVAVFLSGYNRLFEERPELVLDYITAIADRQLLRENTRLTESAYALKEVSSSFINSVSVKLSQLGFGISSRAGIYLEARKAELNNGLSRLEKLPLALLEARRRVLDDSGSRLHESAVSLLASKAKELGYMSELVASKTPERIMKLGYSVVRSNGKAVKSVDDIAVGGLAEIELAEGILEARIEGKSRKINE